MSDNNIKKGLVLEGGAMRGMFTSGILDVLLENNINFDGAIGVSAGATFGCNFKSRQIGRAIRYNLRFAHDWRYCSFLSLLLTGDMYGAKFCYDTLPNKLDKMDFETYRNNPLEFYCVVSDCKSGKPLYKKLETCDEKDLLWMRASASMPLVSKVVKVDGYSLLDGGMTDSIPVKYFESIGYNRNVVVLTQPRGFKKEKSSLMGGMKLLLHKYPAIVKAMEERSQNYNNQTDYVFEKADRGELLVLCPEKPLGISRTEKNTEELKRVYEEGRQIALKRLDEIKKFLNA